MGWTIVQPIPYLKVKIFFNRSITCNLSFIEFIIAQSGQYLSKSISDIGCDSSKNLGYEFITLGSCREKLRIGKEATRPNCIISLILFREFAFSICSPHMSNRMSFPENQDLGDMLPLPFCKDQPTYLIQYSTSLQYYLENHQLNLNHYEPKMCYLFLRSL